MDPLLRLSTDTPRHALVEFLFPFPAARRTTMGILMWWESRRMPYNVAVGTAGLISLAAIYLTHPGPGFPIPWQPIVAYGVMANICYSGGAVAEIIAHRLWGEEVLPMGPAVFRHGLIFSVGLSLLPVLMSGFLLIGRIARFFI
jgi:hypothetical protein